LRGLRPVKRGLFPKRPLAVNGCRLQAAVWHVCDWHPQTSQKTMSAPPGAWKCLCVCNTINNDIINSVTLNVASPLEAGWCPRTKTLGDPHASGLRHPFSAKKTGRPSERQLSREATAARRGSFDRMMAAFVGAWALRPGEDEPIDV